MTRATCTIAQSSVPRRAHSFFSRSAVAFLKSLIISEQGKLHKHSALGPKNDVAGPGGEVLGFQFLKAG